MQISVFWTVQVSALLVFFVPFTWELMALWAASHFLRAIGLTLSFHRYFAHRAFKMNRVARFVWAWIGTAAMQKGPLWWAGHHVNHHKFADRDGDPHSPMLSGVYHAHIGWFLNDTRNHTLESPNPVIRIFHGAGIAGSSATFSFRRCWRQWRCSSQAVSGLSGVSNAGRTLAHATFAITPGTHGGAGFERRRVGNNTITALSRRAGVDNNITVSAHARTVSTVEFDMTWDASARWRPSARLGRSTGAEADLRGGARRSTPKRDAASASILDAVRCR